MLGSACRIAGLSLLVLAWASTAYASPVVPGGLSAGDQYHLVFVTEGTITGDQAPAAYDAFANSEAQRVGAGATGGDMGVTYRALLSTQSTSAASHAAVTAPVYLIDLTLIALDSTDLFDGSILDPLNVDQFGATRDVRVWSGSQANGSIFAGRYVGTPLSGLNPRTGLSSSATGTWLNHANGVASGAFSIYAISEVLTVVPEPSALALLLTVIPVAWVASRRRSL